MLLHPHIECGQRTSVFFSCVKQDRLVHCYPYWKPGPECQKLNNLNVLLYITPRLNIQGDLYIAENCSTDKTKSKKNRELLQRTFREHLKFLQQLLTEIVFEQND